MKKILVSCALAIVVSSSAFAFDFKMPSLGGGADAKQKKAQDLVDDAKRAYGGAQYPKAIALATSAIGESPKFALAYMIRGKAYKDVGDVDNAVKDLNKAIEFDPKMAEAYFIRAQVNEIMGDMKQANDDYKKGCAAGFKDACK